MKNKYYMEDKGGEGAEAYKPLLKYSLMSKIDADLFDESKAVAQPVVRVRRSSSLTKGERWKIFLNDELHFTLEGDKLLKRECVYLRSLEGVNWLIQQFKAGFHSPHELQLRLKEKLKSPSSA